MIVAGFGFRGNATCASLEDALRQAGEADAVAAPEDKANAPAFRALVRKLALPVTQVNPDALREQETITHSDHSDIYRKTGSVAEASALAAAGPGARLVKARVVSGDRLATCALAQTATRDTQT